MHFIFIQIPKMLYSKSSKKRLNKQTISKTARVDLKALLKRWVIRPCLKASTGCGVLMWSGRAFHSLGAAEQKARSPIALFFVLGGFSRYVEVDRWVRVEVCGVRSCLRYGGTSPWMHCWVKRETLCSVLSGTGRQ